MKHVMLDIETLGSKTNSVILSIGACYFDLLTGEIGDTLNIPVSAESCVSAGLDIDASTVLWWMNQHKDAQDKITEGQKKAMPLGGALNSLSGFINSDAQVWGNGATFDNVIIKNAYEKMHMDAPWKFWNDRDVRTIVELGYQIGFNPKRDMPFEGVRHDALADAVHQAKYVSAIWQKLLSHSLS
ncbi:ribonuclease H-like domain protein [Vibrio phage 1.164.O._10N.261.51.A7]|nr:ribonuclease H-like domain protein [Vibrio phage 1.164.O._10N.261.51.A7]